LYSILLEAVFAVSHRDNCIEATDATEIVHEAEDLTDLTVGQVTVRPILFGTATDKSVLLSLSRCPAKATGKPSSRRE
jgi:hypothetical protein